MLKKKLMSLCVAATVTATGLVHGAAAPAHAWSSGNLDVSPTTGGLNGVKWRANELSTGGTFYIISSCDGADIQSTNASSKGNAGQLRTPSGQTPSCGVIPYTMSVGSGNPFSVSMTVGPMPVTMGAVSFAFDLNRNLFDDFSWAPSTGWWEGCANDLVERTGQASGSFSAIRKPCYIPNAGYTGQAAKPVTIGQPMTMVGPLASVSLTPTSFVVTAGGGGALSTPLTSSGLNARMALSDGPGSRSVGVDVHNIPAGATISLTESIQISDPPVRSLPCGDLPAGGFIGRGEHLQSCNNQFRLAVQTDGNVVLYRLSDNYPLCNWGTSDSISGGPMTSHLVMQADGNLVLYRRNFNGPSSALWHTNTWGNPGAYFAVQTDGNLVVYQGGNPLAARSWGGWPCQ